MNKPFSLEEYRKNPSRKIVTGDGRKVRRILCTDAKGNYPVVALVERQDGTGDEPVAYTKDGNYIDGVVSFVHDLFFVTEKHEGWVIIFKAHDGDTYLGNSGIFRTKEEAEECGKNWSGYISSTKIEWEE